MKAYPNSPRLSETLRPFESRKKCQNCGAVDNCNGAPRITVNGWIEHDHDDKPEPRYVFLCKHCARRLIEPHVRLYSQLFPNAPTPGVMDMCADCRHREGSICRCPLLKFNGGPGMLIEHRAGAVSRAMVDSRKPGYSGPITLYLEPPLKCAGYESKPS